MYITEGHFLSPFIVVLKDGEPVGRLISVDTDLKAGIRIVGFDPEDGSPLTDLVAVDEVIFITEDMSDDLQNLIPEGFRKIESIKQVGDKT